MSTPIKKFDFSGKVALVTGSSNGIGAAIAIQLATYGAQLTITGRDASSVEAISKKIEEITGQKPLEVIGDFATDDFLPERLVNETVAKYGRLDILVNNAGIGSVNGHLASPQLMETFDRIMRVNVRSAVELIHRSVQHLEKSQGNVINISSIAGIRPFAQMLAYSSSKAALDMVTKTAAQELGPKHIRVNSVNPGPVYTRIGRSLDNEALFFEMLEQWKQDTALGRVAQPEEIANLVSFLASDDACNITGSIFVNDAGMVLKQ